MSPGSTTASTCENARQTANPLANKRHGAELKNGVEPSAPPPLKPRGGGTFLVDGSSTARQVFGRKPRSVETASHTNREQANASGGTTAHNFFFCQPDGTATRCVVLRASRRSCEPEIGRAHV